MASFQKALPQWASRKGGLADRGERLPRRGREVIESLMGTAARRFLDQMKGEWIGKVPLFKSITEIKNVAYLPFTRQLQDLMLYCYANRRKFILIVRPKLASGAVRTTLSTPLENALKLLKKEGLMEIHYLKKF